MKVLFKVHKLQSDPCNDKDFPLGNPAHDEEELNYILNDRDYYWWVSELDYPPQVGWLIHPPVSPCELRDKGAPVMVLSIELWPDLNQVTAICS